MGTRSRNNKITAQTVLANLFLDTWFDDNQIAAFARTLKATGISSTELDAMLRDEVAPAFVSNLLSVAGEWVLWDEAEVAEILARHRAKPAVMRPLMKRAGRRLVANDWERLKKALETA